MINIKYQLNRHQVEESLICLAWKREGWFKKVNLTILSVLSTMGVIAYAKYPHIFYLFIFVVVTLGLLFTLLYGFDFTRKIKSKKITSIKGYYNIKISEDGIISEDNNKKQYFENNKSEVLISENVITLKIKNDVYCIPLQVLSTIQLKEVLEIFREKCIVRNIKTGRSVVNE